MEGRAGEVIKAFANNSTQKAYRWCYIHYQMLSFELNFPVYNKLLFIFSSSKCLSISKLTGEHFRNILVVS